LSLGLFMKYFLKQKSFKKSKQMYLLLASFLNNITHNIYNGNKYSVNICVKHTPKYLLEVLQTTLTSNKNPNKVVVGSIAFWKNKHYGKIKTKKKGTLKRKIQKKIISNNNIID